LSQNVFSAARRAGSAALKREIQMIKLLICLTLLTSVIYSASHIEEPIIQQEKPETSYLGGTAMLLTLAGFLLLLVSWTIRRFKKEKKCIERALLMKKIGLLFLLAAIVVGLIYVLAPIIANMLGI
jgi:nitrate reductase gamma subunit